MTDPGETVPRDHSVHEAKPINEGGGGSIRDFFLFVEVKLTVHNETRGLQLTNGEESETGTREIIHIYVCTFRC